MKSKKFQKNSPKVSKKSKPEIFSTQKYDLKGSIIEKYCSLFMISNDIIKSEFSKLYYHPNIGVSTSQELHSETLMLIELQRNELVLTSYFYEFLSKHVDSKTQTLQLPTIKAVNDFLYGKDVKVSQSDVSRENVIEQGHYLVFYESTILGIGQINGDKIKNCENISSFLFEE